MTNRIDPRRGVHRLAGCCWLRAPPEVQGLTWMQHAQTCCEREQCRQVSRRHRSVVARWAEDVNLQALVVEAPRARVRRRRLQAKAAAVPRSGSGPGTVGATGENDNVVLAESRTPETPQSCALSTSRKVVLPHVLPLNASAVEALIKPK
jgi:hypothetical protein